MNSGQTEHLSGNSITAVIDHGIFLWQLMWSSGGSDPWPLDSDQFPVYRGNCIYIAPFKTLVNEYFRERREVESGTLKVIYKSSRIKCAVRIIKGITLSTSWQLKQFTPGNDVHPKLPLLIGSHLPCSKCKYTLSSLEQTDRMMKIMCYIKCNSLPSKFLITQ